MLSVNSVFILGLVGPPLERSLGVGSVSNDVVVGVFSSSVLLNVSDASVVHLGNDKFTPLVKRKNTSS